MVGNTNHIQVKYAYRGGWSGEATYRQWLENNIFRLHSLLFSLRLF